MKKLIVLASVAGALAGAYFLFSRSDQSKQEPSEPALKSLQGFSFEESHIAAETPEATAVDAFANGTQTFDESNVSNESKEAEYRRRVDEFKEAFAAAEPCRYVKTLVEIDKPSFVEVFANEPVGQRASASDTALINRLYSQGAFAVKPAVNPVISTKSEEFLMALRNVGLLLGTTSVPLDLAKGEKQLRKIAKEAPDNGAPIFFLSDVLASQKKGGRELMNDLFKTTRFDTSWEDVVRSIERQAEGSPDHFLIGYVLATTVPSPNFLQPLTRIKAWIREGDDELARSALAWAGALAEQARRSAPSLGSDSRGMNLMEYSAFREISNVAREKLKLPLDKTPFFEAMPPADRNWAEKRVSVFEDLQGHKFGEENSVKSAPCDRRTLDREYQIFLTREWRSEL